MGFRIVVHDNFFDYLEGRRVGRLLGGASRMRPVLPRPAPPRPDPPVVCLGFRPNKVFPDIPWMTCIYQDGQLLDHCPVAKTEELPLYRG